MLIDETVVYSWLVSVTQDVKSEAILLIRNRIQRLSILGILLLGTFPLSSEDNLVFFVRMVVLRITVFSG